jgi:hypothetical protein
MWLGGRRGGALNLLAAAALLFAVLGLLRYQQVTQLPPDHVARQAAETPRLTQVSGVITTLPEERLAARRNPFRSQRRTRRTLFELDGVHWTADGEPAPARGRLLVVIDGGVALRLGERVRLAGFLGRNKTPAASIGGGCWRCAACMRCCACQGRSTLLGCRPRRRRGPRGWHKCARRSAKRCGRRT